MDTKGGIPNSNYNVGKITLTYNSPVTTPAGTIGLMDTTQKTTDNNDKYDSNMGIDDMFKGFPETWYGDFTYSLIDPNTGAFVGNTFTIAGEGTYTIIDDGGRKAIEFVPVSSFSGTSQVDVGIENLN
ncbi:hypothetical protein ING2D1G_0057 [Peptoniphilus sp. ING2-D1G]|nr:hypothetical protein ING2D1G_0057 [Peptoniphilus sp. ING2-D1G]